jgi:peptidoglycan/LPS O-acetylase OafA/YrhL
VRLGHIPVLDAVRGIAILLVLAGHADGMLPGGALGVDLFFVLSGFLITSLLLDEWARGGHISFRGFYRRRALRLLPALVVMLAVVTLVAAIRVDGFRTEVVWALFSLGYVINLAAIPNDGIGAENLQHMWSLSQEEQFYLLWPLVLVLVLRAGTRPKALAFLLGGGAALLFGYRIGLAALGAPVGWLWYTPENRSGGLILGCLAAVLFSHGLVRRVPRSLVTLMLVAACATVATVSAESRFDAIVLLPLFTVSATVVLLGLVLHPDWWLARLVNRAPLRGVGRISYGIYLWHWPLFLAFGWVVGLPLVIIVALISYRFVEHPFLRRRHTTRRPETDARSQPTPERVPLSVPHVVEPAA